MGFWRKDVIDFALDYETLRHIREQRAWIAREPANALPYKNLAQLYRIQGRREEALGLLLEAVRLDNGFAEAHVELTDALDVTAVPTNKNYAFRDPADCVHDSRLLSFVFRQCRSEQSAVCLPQGKDAIAEMAQGQREPTTSMHRKEF